MFWIKDLQAMYTSIKRVLKNDGIFIMYDMHPFMHPFDTSETAALKLKRDYTSTGPFGDFSTYMWRLQDILNPIAASGLCLRHMEEMNAEYGTFWIDEDAPRTPELDKLYNSSTNPLYALPQAMALCAQKQR